MKNRDAIRRSRAVRRRNIILTVIAVIAGVLLFFFGFFYVTNIEVVGNTRYTAEEVENLCVTNPLQRNSVLFSIFWRDMDFSEVPFMKSISSEFIDRNTIRLHVNEKTPIGYVSDGTTDYYFDQDGLVLEAISVDNETTGGEAASADQPAEQTDGSTDAAAENAGAETGTEGTDESVSGVPEAGTIVNGNGEVQTDSSQSYGSSADNVNFTPALSNVPLITGLETGTPAVDQTLQIDESRLNTIQALSKLLERYEIPPDQVEFDESGNMTLYYGTVRIALGTDSNLEEKMARVNAILPKLDGESGVLHLEDFSEDTQNIIFDRDQ